MGNRGWVTKSCIFRKDIREYQAISSALQKNQYVKNTITHDLLRCPYYLTLPESQWSATEAESIDAKRATLAVLARAGRFDRLTEMWPQSTLWPSSSSQSTQQARGVRAIEK